MSEINRGQPKGLENEPLPESVDLNMEEDGEDTVVDSGHREVTAVGSVPSPEILAGQLPDLGKLFGEKKPGLKAEEFKALAETIDGLASVEGNLTVHDIERLLPPETVVTLSRWQLHSVRSHVRKALRKRYMDRMETAMARRGDISELSEEERTAREERYATDVTKIDEEYGYADLLSRVTRYLEKDSGEKF